MKIIVKIEDGKPVLFFPDETHHNKHIQCFSVIDGHTSATRAYMRSLKNPETPDEILHSWLMLARYCKNSAYSLAPPAKAA
jgi:hypothetical protein